MQITINFKAVQTIYALSNHQQARYIEASEFLFKIIEFNFSIHSLNQIQDFISTHSTQLQPDDLQMMGFYIAEVFARLSQQKIYWLEDDGITYAALSDLNDQHFQQFFSLDDLNQAYGQHQNNFIEQLAVQLDISIPKQNTEHPLPTVQPEQQQDYLKAFGQLDAKTRQSFQSYRPQWCNQQDDLYQYFDEIDVLLEHGALIRSHIVQANRLLYGDQFVVGCPAEVIYDPMNKLLNEDLEVLAGYLFSLRHRDNLSPVEQNLAAHLNNEVERALGHYLPIEVFGYPLCTSTLYIDQQYLPNGILIDGNLPILISPQYSKYILLLPCHFWHQDLIQQWKQASYQKFDREITLEQMMIDAGVSQATPPSQIKLFTTIGIILVIFILIIGYKLFV